MASLKNKKRIAPGSFASVICAVLNSKEFLSLRPKTQANWKRYLFLAQRPELPNLGALDVNDIDRTHVRAFVHSFPTPGTQTNALTAVRWAAQWAMDNNMLPPIPIADKIKHDKCEGHHTPWTEAQIAWAVANVRPDYARIIGMMGYTGQRHSDVKDIRWSDIEVIDGDWVLPVEEQKKTGVYCPVPVCDELKALLLSWKRPSAAEVKLNPNLDYICLKLDGTPWDDEVSTNFNKTIRPMHPELKELKLHGLRGSCCLRLRALGATDGEIGSMVGMSVPMVTNYTAKADKRAANLATMRRITGRVRLAA